MPERIPSDAGPESARMIRRLIAERDEARAAASNVTHLEPTSPTLASLERMGADLTEVELRRMYAALERECDTKARTIAHLTELCEQASLRAA